MRKILKIAGAIIAILIIALVIVFALAALDVGSYSSDANSSQTLPAKGTLVGNALVVFDPGMSGAAKNVATAVASSLQDNGYQVCLAGIKSQAATNYSASGYDIIVVGGPCYMGKAATSVQNYLKTFNPPQNTTVGAFGIGALPPDGNTTQIIAKEVAPLPNGSAVTIKAAMKIVTGEDINEKSTNFVNELLKVYSLPVP
jgi:menaquinone-dependent protoporphyrinogen IX oxidase